MAETISDFLKSPAGEGKTILVLAGNGHIAFGFGIPRRLRRRIPLPYQTVLKEKEDPKGIWIERVTPESPAEKAGLLPGDQFVSFDGKEVQSLKDIHDAVAHKGWGKEVVIIILREGVNKEIRVILPPLKE
jgi:S1-C subfamily serine protease